ncbi:MAG: MFS transporter [Oscillospiraceae bacterium]|nr:MFS transporter [Oscillospiraceae bacterium]
MTTAMMTTATASIRRPGLNNIAPAPKKRTVTKMSFNLIAIQALYYTFVGMHGSFLVLYYGSIGFSATQIGLITSVSTFAVLLTQPVWGQASDRAKDGRTVLSFLFLTCAVLIFAFYITTDYMPVLVIATVFAIFFNPLVPMMDSLTLETIAVEKSGFDYGHVRIGGALGYSTMVILGGQILKNSFIHMFYISSILCLAALFFVRRVNAVKLRGKREPLSFRALLRNKKVFCFMFVNLIHSFGMMGFYQFYPLHFTAHVAGSEWFGVLLCTTAMSELPFWIFSGKITRRFGYERMMLISITVVSFRWFILYFLTNLPLILIVNLLHGFCFVTICYCVINYINEEIPSELRATGQAMNNMAAMVISRLIGGAAFGALSDVFGIDRMFLFLSALSFMGAIVFFFWLRVLGRSGVSAAKA